jgi:hypothetical protein
MNLPITCEADLLRVYDEDTGLEDTKRDIYARRKESNSHSLSNNSNAPFAYYFQNLFQHPDKTSQVQTSLMQMLQFEPTLAPQLKAPPLLSLLFLQGVNRRLDDKLQIIMPLIWLADREEGTSIADVLAEHSHMLNVPQADSQWCMPIRGPGFGSSYDIEPAATAMR